MDYRDNCKSEPTPEETGIKDDSNDSDLANALSKTTNTPEKEIYDGKDKQQMITAAVIEKRDDPWVRELEKAVNTLSGPINKCIGKMLVERAIERTSGSLVCHQSKMNKDYSSIDESILTIPREISKRERQVQHVNLSRQRNLENSPVQERENAENKLTQTVQYTQIDLVGKFQYNLDDACKSSEGFKKKMPCDYDSGNFSVPTLAAKENFGSEKNVQYGNVEFRTKHEFSSEQERANDKTKGIIQRKLAETYKDVLSVINKSGGLDTKMSSESDFTNVSASATAARRNSENDSEVQHDNVPSLIREYFQFEDREYVETVKSIQRDMLEKLNDVFNDIHQSFEGIETIMSRNSGSSNLSVPTLATSESESKVPQNMVALKAQRELSPVHETRNVEVVGNIQRDLAKMFEAVLDLKVICVSSDGLEWRIAPDSGSTNESQPTVAISKSESNVKQANVAQLEPSMQEDDENAEIKLDEKFKDIEIDLAEKFEDVRNKIAESFEDLETIVARDLYRIMLLNHNVEIEILTSMFDVMMCHLQKLTLNSESFAKLGIGKIGQKIEREIDGNRALSDLIARVRMLYKLQLAKIKKVIEDSIAQKQDAFLKSVAITIEEMKSLIAKVQMKNTTRIYKF